MENEGLGNQKPISLGKKITQIIKQSLYKHQENYEVIFKKLEWMSRTRCTQPKFIFLFDRMSEKGGGGWCWMSWFQWWGTKEVWFPGACKKVSQHSVLRLRAHIATGLLKWSVLLSCTQYFHSSCQWPKVKLQKLAGGLSSEGPTHQGGQDVPTDKPEPGVTRQGQETGCCWGRGCTPPPGLQSCVMHHQPHTPANTPFRCSRCKWGLAVYPT